MMPAAADSRLDQVVPMRLERFRSLTDVWLHTGATSFEIDVDGVCVWSVGEPPGGSAVRPGGELTCRQQLGGSHTLDLRVMGVGGPAAVQRLALDAELVAETIRLDDELQQMTGELIDTQDQLLAIFGLVKATRRRLSLDEVLTQLVGEVRQLTGAELAFAAVAGAAGGKLVVSPPGGQVHATTLWRVADWVRTSRASLLANTPADLPLDVDPSRFVENLVVVPVAVEGALQATLGVVNQRVTTVSAARVKLLQALGEQAGALVEAALSYERALIRERLQREMELAAEMQSGLMADAAPQVPGVQIVARFRPAREVGGDFYHHRLRPDGQLSFSVGDVSGKGMPAALIMGMSRNLLRGTSQLLGRPDAVVEQVNADLYDDLNRVNTFVTAFVGFYDPAQQLVRFANAGHSPVVYCPSGETPRMLPATSLPLGIFEDSTATDDCVRMSAGDVLVVGTDGFSEATDLAGDVFGYERLLDLVHELADQPSEAIVDGLFAAITEFGEGAPQDDDQTLLVVKGC